MRRITVLVASLLLACATPTSDKDAARDTSARPVRGPDSASAPSATPLEISASAAGATTSASAPPSGSSAPSARAVPYPAATGAPARAASSAVAVPPSAIPEEPTPPPAVFACPMHPEVRAASAGKCSKCGMPLEPANSK